MTPKEKAKELMDKFKGFGNRTAKQCALIAVDEIIDENNLYNRKLSPVLEERIRYWQEVKQQIIIDL